MIDCNSVETLTNTHSNLDLSDQTKFRLHEMFKTTDYFSSKIQERNTMRKKLSKYIAAFDYIDKSLIISSATSGGINTFSVISVI